MISQKPKVEFASFQKKCPLQYENGLALSKMEIPGLITLDSFFPTEILQNWCKFSSSFFVLTLHSGLCHQHGISEFCFADFVQPNFPPIAPFFHSIKPQVQGNKRTSQTPNPSILNHQLTPKQSLEVPGLDVNELKQVGYQDLQGKVKKVYIKNSLSDCTLIKRNGKFHHELS